MSDTVYRTDEATTEDKKTAIKLILCVFAFVYALISHNLFQSEQLSFSTQTLMIAGPFIIALISGFLTNGPSVIVIFLVVPALIASAAYKSASEDISLGEALLACHSMHTLDIANTCSAAYGEYISPDTLPAYVIREQGSPYVHGVIGYDEVTTLVAIAAGIGVDTRDYARHVQAGRMTSDETQELRRRIVERLTSGDIGAAEAAQVNAMLASIAAR